MGTKSYKENILWLDKKVNNKENTKYQDIIIKMNKFNLFPFTETKKCIILLKEIHYVKTYIIISGSISKEFFVEFEKIIEEINVKPIIIIFTSTAQLNKIKNNAIALDKYSVFDSNLVFDNFEKVKNKIISENKYDSKYIDKKQFSEIDNCFTFEYPEDLRDLIFPLTFTEFIEIPSKKEINDFNNLLLKNYSNKAQMKNLIEQLLTEESIPFQILVKYWVRAYTAETNFYKHMNFELERRKGENKNDFDIYIKILYKGLLNKVINPLIEEKLYRGAKIKKSELEKMKESLEKKKKNLPGCLCYNNSFLSSSLDRNVAIKFMINREIENNEERVLYIFEKGQGLDKENASNADIEEYSFYQKEKEILFFLFLVLRL